MIKVFRQFHLIINISVPAIDFPAYSAIITSRKFTGFCFHKEEKMIGRISVLKRKRHFLSAPPLCVDGLSQIAIMLWVSIFFYGDTKLRGMHPCLFFFRSTGNIWR